MSMSLHIVRDPESPDTQISKEEWLNCINSDPEIQQKHTANIPENSIVATVIGAEDWETLCWSDGSLSADSPQKKMLSKMFDIADRLSAVLMLDDGVVLKRGPDGKVVAEEY